ncbi:MAG: hypothetical protein AB1752_02470 [Candidatus Zixiibacteriota bacterium]
MRSLKRQMSTVLIRSITHWFLPGIVLVSLFASTASSADVADSLHKDAWDRMLDEAAYDPAAAFAFYAYRTIAVAHPEVYLLADSLFSGIIENMPGSRFAFRDQDRRDIELYRKLQRGEQEGAPFRWRNWEPAIDSISDEGWPRRSWLDTRLPSAAVLLRADSKRLTTLEAAALRYTSLRRGGIPADSLYIIVDTRGQGHLSQGGVIRSASTGMADAGDPARINPALVFNEECAFYPLMERDDRTASASLARVVATLGPPGDPALDGSERKRADRLASLTSLKRGEAKQFALMVSLGAIGVTEESIKSALSECFPSAEEAGAHLGVVPGMIRDAIRRANQLSIPAARLAGLAVESPAFDKCTPVLEEHYLDLAGRRVRPDVPSDSTRTAWGYLWSYELLDVTFDDIIRTRAGRGSSQALAMSAILQLASIPNVRVEFDTGESPNLPEQHWVLSPDGRWQFNVGMWGKVPARDASAARIAVLLASLGVGDDWVEFTRCDHYCDWDYLAVAQELAHLEAAMGAMAISVGQPKHDAGETGHAHGHHEQKTVVVPIGEFARRLTSDEIHWDPVPWPPIGLTRPAEEGTGP